MHKYEIFIFLFLTWISGSYGVFIPTFLRNIHSLLHSGYVNLHSHQQCKRVPFSSQPLQHLLFVGFLMMAILTSVRGYLIVVLICISLVMSSVEHLCSVEHLFMCLLAICMSLEKCLFSLFPTFWLDRFFSWFDLYELLVYFWNIISCLTDNQLCFICY